MYQEFFTLSAPEDSIDLNDQQLTLSLGFGDPVDGADPGVEIEAKMTPEQLAVNLGFVDNRPFTFNEFRHNGGLTSWDSGSARLFDRVAAKQNPDMIELMLHWHQMAGAHSMSRMWFTPGPEPERCLGSLIADEVGVGKTGQATAVIAILTELVMRQNSEPKRQLPPFFRKFNLFLSL